MKLKQQDFFLIMLSIPSLNSKRRQSMLYCDFFQRITHFVKIFILNSYNLQKHNESLYSQKDNISILKVYNTRPYSQTEIIGIGKPHLWKQKNANDNTDIPTIDESKQLYILYAHDFPLFRFINMQQNFFFTSFKRIYLKQ